MSPACITGSINGHVLHGWKSPYSGNTSCHPPPRGHFIPCHELNDDEETGQLVVGQHQGIRIQEMMWDCFGENYLCKSLLHINSVI